MPAELSKGSLDSDMLYYETIFSSLSLQATGSTNISLPNIGFSLLYYRKVDKPLHKAAISYGKSR